MTNSASILKRLLSYPLQHRDSVIWALLLLVLASVADTLGPVLIKWFIDDYLVKDTFPVVDITLLVATYLLINVAAAFFGYRQALAFNEIAQRVVLKIRQQIFQHVLHLPLKKFDFTPAGSLVSRITNDTEAIKELFVGVLDVYIRNTFRVFAIFVAMAWLNWQLMLVCAVFVPVVVILMLVYRKISTPIFQQARSLISDINARLNESIQGVSIIQIFNQQQRFSEDFKTLSENHFATRFKGIRLDAVLLRPMVDLLYLVTLGSLLFYFGITSMDSAIEVGVIYAFVNYLGRFTEPLIEMTQRLNIFQQSVVSAGRVFEWLDEEVESFAEQSDKKIETGSVSFKEVIFGYQPDFPVLKGLNFAIESGEFVGLVGHTGSGKSSIASLMLRFYSPQQGRVEVGGVNLESLSNEEIREKITIVQQDSFLFSGSLFSNIAIGRAVSKDKIKSACRDIGLHEFIAKLPGGYDYAVSEKGANLSAGQRQLVSLARALVGDPLILILDEATASIDSQTESLVQRALLKLKGKMTVVVIAHRLSTIVEADRILVMHRGEINQQGRHRDLLEVEGLYKHLYQLQTREIVLEASEVK